jgi:hypothetical protein
VTLEERGNHESLAPQLPDQTPRRRLIPDFLRRHASIAGAVALLVAGTAALLLWQSGGSQDAPARGPRQHAVAAQGFADSVGVNVHVNYMDTAYRNIGAVQRALAQLGVHHVRDGACAGCSAMYPRMLALARRGVRFTLIAGDPRNSTGTLTANLGAIASRLRGATEAIEGPNEWDASGDGSWARHVRDYQRSLFEAVRANPRLKSLPVIGPSFVRPESRDQVGNLSAWMTQGNMHSYPGGDPPEANLDSELALARKVSGPHRILSTETGYTNARFTADGRPAVPESVAASYIPRLYLENFRRGVPRTFLYELFDEKPDPSGGDAEQHFGLLRADGTPKPAFTALRGLMRAIGTGSPGSSGATLHYTLHGAGADVRRLLFAGGGGVRSLVLWRAVSAWDPATGKPRPVTPERVTVRLGESVGATSVLRRGVTLQRSTAPHDVTVSLGADPVVVRMEPSE